MHRLLECNPVGDLELERLLTTVRATLLKAAIESAESSNDQTLEPSLLDFYCAVARQCFVNEYVFSTTESEIDQVQRLCASLEAALTAGLRFPPLWLAAVGAYFPLHTLPSADALLDRSWPDTVDALLVQQVKEPAEERRMQDDNSCSDEYRQ